MRSPNRALVWRLLLGCILAGYCAGCAQWLWPTLADDPQAAGTWTGRLLSVTVRDYDGREYQAAALDVGTGPRTLRGTSEAMTVKEGDDLALLCPVGVQIIDPAGLKVPVGSRVKVSGRMLMASPSSTTGADQRLASPVPSHRRMSRIAPGIWSSRCVADRRC